MILTMTLDGNFSNFMANGPKASMLEAAPITEVSREKSDGGHNIVAVGWAGAHTPSNSLHPLPLHTQHLNSALFSIRA